MFTGIIEEVGNVLDADEGALRIACSTILDGTALGDSIAINGVDLTVAAMDTESLSFNCMPETYRRSNLGRTAPGRSRQPRTLTPSHNPPLGHLVRGVTEATGELISLTPEGDAILARYSAPSDILRHTVVKGPITIDGASPHGYREGRTFAHRLARAVHAGPHKPHAQEARRQRQPGERHHRPLRGTALNGAPWHVTDAPSWRLTVIETLSRLDASNILLRLASR